MLLYYHVSRGRINAIAELVAEQIGKDGSRLTHLFSHEILMTNPMRFTMSFVSLENHHDPLSTGPYLRSDNALLFDYWPFFAGILLLSRL